MSRATVVHWQLDSGKGLCGSKAKTILGPVNCKKCLRKWHNSGGCKGMEVHCDICQDKKFKALDRRLKSLLEGV